MPAKIRFDDPTPRERGVSAECMEFGCLYRNTDPQLSEYVYMAVPRQGTHPSAVLVAFRVGHTPEYFPLEHNKPATYVRLPKGWSMSLTVE